MFAFQGVVKPVTSLDDFGATLATHPLFAQAWAQKLCFYANSRRCAADDPELQRIVSVFQTSSYSFQTSSYSWSALVRELMASPITTNAKPTRTLSDDGEIIAVSRRDLIERRAPRDEPRRTVRGEWRFDGGRTAALVIMWKDHVPIGIFAALSLLGALLGYRARLAANAHDEPVPASEPRAQIAAVVDLPPRVGCDEAFDLALYSSSGVELVTWDGAGRPRRCDGRHVTVKYLPGRLRRSALLERIERIAVSVKVEQ